MSPVPTVVVLALAFAGALAADARAGNCLSRLQRDPAHFERCRAAPGGAALCMLFISEGPFTMVPDRLVAQDNQTLFRCRDRHAFAPGMRGIGFDVQNRIGALSEAWCVFAGSNCTFGGMIDLASDNGTVAAGYRFGVGGLAFLLPHRVRPTLKPLAPILDGRFVLVGPRAVRGSRSDALAVLTAPFERMAWFSIAAVAAFLALLWIVAVWRTSRSIRLPALARAVIGQPEYKRLPLVERARDRAHWEHRVEGMHLSNDLALTSVRFAVKAFLAVAIIFYEIAVVYYIAERRDSPVTVNLQDMSEEKLKAVTLVHGGATEDVFRKTVDPKDVYKFRQPPWQKCWPIDDCFNMVLNKTAGLFVTYDFAVRFHLEKMGACDKLAVYNTRHEGASFTGTWYVNTNFPEENRDAVNKELIALTLHNEVKKITEEFAVPSKTTCGQQSGTKIVVGILGPLFAIILSPLVLVVVASLSCGFVMERGALRLSKGRMY